MNVRPVFGERQRVQTGLTVTAKAQHADHGYDPRRQQRNHQIERPVAQAYRGHQSDDVFGRHVRRAVEKNTSDYVYSIFIYTGCDSEIDTARRTIVALESERRIDEKSITVFENCIYNYTIDIKLGLSV